MNFVESSEGTDLARERTCGQTDGRASYRLLIFFFFRNALKIKIQENNNKFLNNFSVM